MLKLYNGSLSVNEILSSWYDEFRDQNYGAMIHFVGIVRDENEISGLSFDIYEPLLQIWFKNWQEKAANLNAKILMAHSIGDVPNHTSSYIACVLSPKRKTALKLINDFVEDFKANAPIWKYDLKNGKRIWAKDRSKALFGAGILA